MKLTLLGTGSPIPAPDRAGSANLVQVGGHHLLFDCGRGVVMRLAAAGVLPGFLTRLFLTHLHSDHITDFNDVVTTRWAMSPVENPLSVIGPPGTARFAELTLAMLHDDIGYRIAHHDDLTWQPGVEVAEIVDGVAWESGDVRVIAAPTDHRPVTPTIGYRVEHAGQAVVLAGDTVPCAGLDRLVAGADVYVQTVVRPDLVMSVPSARFHDVCDYHSSCEQAGATAARGGVAMLVLTHQVPPPTPGTEQEWIDQARSGGFGGEIVFANDLTVVDLT
jgi:ribonuclease Z